MEIRLVTETFGKKVGTKTVWELTGSADDAITEEQYGNMVNSMPMFRRMGGSERAERGYTYAGYRVIRIVSTSPSKDKRVIRSFTFQRGR